RSHLRVDSAINRTRRGFTTTTSCPKLVSSRAPHGVEPPHSITTRHRGVLSKRRRYASRLVAKRSRWVTLPCGETSHSSLVFACTSRQRCLTVGLLSRPQPLLVSNRKAKPSGRRPTDSSHLAPRLGGCVSSRPQRVLPRPSTLVRSECRPAATPMLDVQRADRR